MDELNHPWIDFNLNYFMLLNFKTVVKMVRIENEYCLEIAQ